MNTNKNPFFDSQMADMIIFDVRGSSETSIVGYTEVFGQQSDFILSNK